MLGANATFDNVNYVLNNTASQTQLSNMIDKKYLILSGIQLSVPNFYENIKIDLNKEYVYKHIPVEETIVNDMSKSDILPEIKPMEQIQKPIEKNDMSEPDNKSIILPEIKPMEQIQKPIEKLEIIDPLEIDEGITVEPLETKDLYSFTHDQDLNDLSDENIPIPIPQKFLQFIANATKNNKLDEQTQTFLSDLDPTIEKRILRIIIGKVVWEYLMVNCPDEPLKDVNSNKFITVFRPDTEIQTLFETKPHDVIFFGNLQKYVVRLFSNNQEMEPEPEPIPTTDHVTIVKSTNFDHVNTMQSYIIRFLKSNSTNKYVANEIWTHICELSEHHDLTLYHDEYASILIRLLNRSFIKKVDNEYYMYNV